MTFVHCLNYSEWYFDGIDWLEPYLIAIMGNKSLFGLVGFSQQYGHSRQCHHKLKRAKCNGNHAIRNVVHCVFLDWYIYFLGKTANQEIWESGHPVFFCLRHCGVSLLIQIANYSISSLIPSPTILILITKTDSNKENTKQRVLEKNWQCIPTRVARKAQHVEPPKRTLEIQNHTQNSHWLTLITSLSLRQESSGKGVGRGYGKSRFESL